MSHAIRSQRSVHPQHRAAVEGHGDSVGSVGPSRCRALMGARNPRQTARRTVLYVTAWIQAPWPPPQRGAPPLR
jgi:hypothetical protein